MNIPNLLTVLRFCLVPALAVTYCKGWYWAALFIFLFASFTDMLDGYIARKYNLITDWGKVMDPLADKIMLVTVLFCFYFVDKAIPLFIAIVCCVKELLMVLGGIFLYKKRDMVVFSKIYGKIATGLFFLGIVLTFLRQYTAPYNLYVLYVALALSLFSLVMYGATTFLKGKSAK